MQLTIYAPSPAPSARPAAPLRLVADTPADAAALLCAAIGVPCAAVTRSSRGVVLDVPALGHVHAVIEGAPAAAAAAAAKLFAALQTRRK